MRDVAVAAELRKCERVFCARDHVRAVPEQPPAPRDGADELRPILEAGAADDAGGCPSRCQALERGEHAVAAHSEREALGETNMGARRRYRVLIAEEVRDQRD